MANTDSSTVVVVFLDPNQARQAVDDLHQAGFRDDQIGFAARDQANTIQGTTTTGDTRAGEHVGTGVATGAVTGVATGAVTGVVAGGLLGGLLGAATALLIPGVGPVIAGGILVSTLMGAAVGAAAGGIIGALTDMGVPEDEAGFYNNEFQAGRTIVIVTTPGRQQEARDILHRNGGYDANTHGTQTAGYAPGRTTGTTSTTNTAGTMGTMGTMGTTGYGTYDTPMGNTPGAQGSAARWEDVAPQYRTDWQQRYGSGGRWEDYEPYYRYGWETYNNPRYQGRPWSDVEMELRRDWESRFPNTPWDQAQSTLQSTWETNMYNNASTTTSQDYNQRQP
jgi:hypothetical protein